MEKPVYYISFDVSTTNIGIALWDKTGDLVELKHLKLEVDKSVSKEERYLDKADIFSEYIKKYKTKIENEFDGRVKDIFVEAPLSNTPKNINTTALLLGFNGIACYVLYKTFNIKPKLISVYDSRKLFCPELVSQRKEKGKIKETLSFPKDVDKKKYIWEKVAKLEPEVEWFYARTGSLKNESMDMSDSYCVGFSSLIVLGVIDYTKWLDINKNVVYI